MNAQKRFFLFALSALLAGAPLTARAASSHRRATLKSVLSAMDKAERDVRSISFKFTQKTSIKATGDEQSISGTADFQRPDSFKVVHESPVRQEVVSDGVTLWFYTPSRNQAYKDKAENWLKGNVSKSVMSLQTDVSDLKKRFDISLDKKRTRESKKGVVLSLSPKDPGPWPFTMRLWVDPDTGLPLRSEMEGSGSRVVTEISSTTLNPVFSSDFFSFNPPAGVEVLDAPGGDAGGE